MQTMQWLTGADLIGSRLNISLSLLTTATEKSACRYVRLRYSNPLQRTKTWANMEVASRTCSLSRRHLYCISPQADIFLVKAANCLLFIPSSDGSCWKQLLVNLGELASRTS